MKTVYPNGFTFRIEKNLRDLNGMPSGPQLTIEANFEDVMSSKHVDKKDTSQTVLITRRNLFETALIDITKKHHQVCEVHASYHQSMNANFSKLFFNSLVVFEITALVRFQFFEVMMSQKCLNRKPEGQHYFINFMFS